MATNDQPSAANNGPNLLVIDPDPLVCVVVRRALEGIPHRLSSASAGDPGLTEVASQEPDLVILDCALADGRGLEMISQVRQLAPRALVIGVAARGFGSTAIEAIKLGAFDYLPKPLEPAPLRDVVKQGWRQRLDQLAEDEARGSNQSEPDTPQESAVAPGGLVGECPPMQAVFKTIGRLAPLSVPVLIRGEPGSGKKSLASELHRHGNKSNGPWVTLDCQSHCEESFAGEFDAAAARAADGMLVLQEAGRMSLAMQSRLLHAIEQESGCDSYQESSACRLVALSSDDLESLVGKGEFRADLYYTLSSHSVTLPPLRQRLGDLPLLIRQMVKNLKPLTDAMGVDEPTVSDDVMGALCSHVWPGNIDELQSVLRRAIVAQKGRLRNAGDIKQMMQGAPTAEPKQDNTRFTTDWAAFTQVRIESSADTLHSDAIAETEQKLFSRVLRHTGGNQAHASRILGITRASLRKKLRLYGMSVQQVEE